MSRPCTADLAPILISLSFEFVSATESNAQNQGPNVKTSQDELNAHGREHPLFLPSSIRLLACPRLHAFSIGLPRNVVVPVENLDGWAIEVSSVAQDAQ